MSTSENSSGSVGAVGTKYASISGDLGTAPYISTVPLPGAALLLGSGILGLIGLRRHGNKN